jgi:hypothetical protein
VSRRGVTAAPSDGRCACCPRLIPPPRPTPTATAQAQLQRKRGRRRGAEGAIEAEWAGRIPPRELRALAGLSAAVQAARGWRGGRYCFSQAWARVEARAAGDAGGGWDACFEPAGISGPRLAALAAVIDAELLGGRLLAPGGLLSGPWGRGEGRGRRRRTRPGRGGGRPPRSEQAGGGEGPEVQQPQSARRPERQDRQRQQRQRQQQQQKEGQQQQQALLLQQRRQEQQQRQQRQQQPDDSGGAPAWPGGCEERQHRPGAPLAADAVLPADAGPAMREERPAPVPAAAPPPPPEPEPAPPRVAAARAEPLSFVAADRPAAGWLAYFDEAGAVVVNRPRWAKPVSRAAPVNCEGVVCTSRLQVLAHTLAHEMVHALVFFALPRVDAACAAYLADGRHGPVFQLLNRELFGHPSNALAWCDARAALGGGGGGGG